MRRNEQRTDGVPRARFHVNNRTGPSASKSSHWWPECRDRQYIMLGRERAGIEGGLRGATKELLICKCFHFNCYCPRPRMNATDVNKNKQAKKTRCDAKIETDNTFCYKLATVRLIKDMIYDCRQSFIAGHSNYLIKCTYLRELRPANNLL